MLKKFVVMMYLDDHSGEEPDLFFILAKDSNEAENIACKRKGFTEEEIAYLNDEHEEFTGEKNDYDTNWEMFDAVRFETYEVTDDLFTE